MSGGAYLHPVLNVEACRVDRREAADAIGGRPLRAPLGEVCDAIPPLLEEVTRVLGAALVVVLRHLPIAMSGFHQWDEVVDAMRDRMHAAHAACPQDGVAVEATKNAIDASVGENQSGVANSNEGR